MPYWVTKETKPLYLSDVINILQKNEFDVQEWDFIAIGPGDINGYGECSEHIDINGNKYIPLRGKDNWDGSVLMLNYFLRYGINSPLSIILNDTIHSDSYEVKDVFLNVTDFIYPQHFRNALAYAISLNAYNDIGRIEYGMKPNREIVSINFTSSLASSSTIKPFFHELSELEVLDLSLKIYRFFRHWTYDFKNDPKTAEIIKMCSTFERDSEEMNNYVKAQVDKIEKQMLMKYQKMINDFRWK